MCFLTEPSQGDEHGDQLSNAPLWAFPLPTQLTRLHCFLGSPPKETICIRLLVYFQENANSQGVRVMSQPQSSQ